MVAENHLNVNDLIAPVFVVEGSGVKEEMPSMPDYYRYSTELLVEEAKAIRDLGIPSILLFAKVPDSNKDNKGTEALEAKGLMQQDGRILKEEVADLLAM